MSALEITPVALAVHRPGTNPIIGEDAIRIELSDEGGGFFFRIWNADVLGGEPLRLDPDEMDALCEAGRKLMEGMQ